MTSRAHVRPASSSDAQMMKGCVEAAYRHYVARMGKPPGPMHADYTTVVRQDIAFVAEHDGELVGVLVLARTSRGLLLDNVAVHPRHQGRGLGKRLIALAESEARSRGQAALTLYTHECMNENIAMYQALGYAVTERRSEHGYQRVYMRKAL